MLASAGGFSDVVEALLKAGANTRATDSSGNTALMLARNPTGDKKSFYADHGAVVALLTKKPVLTEL